MQIHFPTSLHLRVPQGLPKAVQQAAKQRHQTPAEWLRQTLLRGLEAEGVRLSDSGATNLSNALVLDASSTDNHANDDSHRT
jgi:hypothetical protein